MTTLTLAKKKWARKMARAGKIWKDHVTGKESALAKNLGDFLGITISVSHDRIKNWTAGIADVTAADFEAATTGKEEIWATKLKDAFS